MMDAEQMRLAQRPAPPLDYAAACEAQRQMMSRPPFSGLESTNAARNTAAPPGPQSQLKGELWAWQIPRVRRIEWEARQKGHDVRLEVGPGLLVKPFILKGPRDVMLRIHAAWKADDRALQRLTRTS